MEPVFDPEHTVINSIVLHEIKMDGRQLQDPVFSQKELSCDEKTKNAIKSRIVDVMGVESRSFEALVDESQKSLLVKLTEEFFEEDDADFFDFTKEATMIYKEALQTSSTKKKEGILISVYATENFPGNKPKEIVVFIKATKISAIRQDRDTLQLVDDLFLSADSRFYKIGLIIKKDNGVPVENINDNFKFYVFDDQIKGGSARYFLNTFLGFSIDKNSKKRTQHFYDTCVSFMLKYIPPSDAYNFEGHLKSYLKNEEKVISASDFKERHIPEDLGVYYDMYIEDADLETSFIKNNELIKYQLKTNTIPFSNKVKVSYPSGDADDVKIITEEVDFNDMEFDPDFTIVRVKGIPYRIPKGKNKPS